MQFFELENIAAECATSFVNTKEGFSNLVAAVTENKSYSQEQKGARISFLNELSSPLSFIFYQWILDDVQLKNALIHEELTVIELNKKNYLQHAEKDNFKRFLSPFLTPILLEKCNHPTLEDAHKVLGYSQLLDTPYKVQVHNASKPYFERELKNLQSKKTIAIGCNAQFISALNLLDRTFYNVLASYIKIVCSLLTDSEVSLSEKQRLATAARRLAINQDHRAELNNFIKRAGVNQVKLGVLRASRKKLLWGAAVISLATLLIYFLPFYQLKSNTNAVEIIPPYGTDSLTVEQISQLNKLFSLRADTLNQHEAFGIEMDQFINDTIQADGN